MERIFAGFVPFIDEHHWWLNQFTLGNRDCSCSRCGRETYEAGMDDVSELCWECAAEVESARIVVIEDEPDEHEGWSEERKQVEAWLYLRGL
jgi:predicted amidophosphoribosyltransferase